MKTSRWYAIGLMALLLTVACAHPQKAPDTESALRERVNAYWQHRINGELAEAYLFEHPAVRKNVNLTHYIQGLSTGGIQLQEVSINSVTIQGDKAAVGMTKSVRFHAMRSPRKGVPMRVTEHWEIEDGTWYRSREEKPQKKGPRRYSPDALVY